jgi:hypothetical protein
MATVARLLDQHQSGERDHSAALWSPSMFEAFLRQVHGCGARAEAHPDTVASVALSVVGEAATGRVSLAPPAP